MGESIEKQTNYMMLRSPRKTSLAMGYLCEHAKNYSMTHRALEEKTEI